MALRDYQTECLKAVWEGYKRGLRRQLVCLPTGTGKTVVFAHIPKHFRMKKRMLVVAHRKELLDQARAQLAAASPELKVDIEQADRRASPEADVVVASVQTIGRAGSKRLGLLPPDQFSIIVIDEAHHSVASTYKNVIDHFGLMQDDTPKLLLGVTATPRRGDNRGLDEVYQDITFSRNLRQMIEAEYLCPIVGYRVGTEVDLTGVSVRMGDFATGQLSRQVNVFDRNDLLVRAYQELVKGRKALVFCVDVEHAQDVASAFVNHQVPCRAVWGNMHPDDRADALAAFRKGQVRVLTNCNVLTEGYDEPTIESVVMGRPTKSALLYAQMVGRGTRLAPGKEHLTVIDVVDNSSRHQLVGLAALFGYASDFDLRGGDVLHVARRFEELKSRYPYLKLERAKNLEDLKLLIERVDLLCTDVPEAIRGLSRFSWFEMPDESYRLSLGTGELLVIAPNLLDRYDLWHFQQDAETKTVTRERIESTRDLGDAFAVAEDFVEEVRPETVRLVQRDLRWRADPATQKQLDLLRRHGIKLEPGLTKGQASLMISQLFEKRRMTQAAAQSQHKSRPKS